MFLMCSCTNGETPSESSQPSSDPISTTSSEDISSETSESSEETSSSESSIESSSESSSSSSSSEESIPQSLIDVTKDISLLPNRSVNVVLEGESEGLNVSIQNEDIVDVVVKNKNEISVIGLMEGNTRVEVLNKEYRYIINVECIDLSITNEASYVEKGQTLQVTLSKNVNASYEIDNDEIASISETGIITAHKEGTFKLSVKYKEIILEKDFDTYVRKTTLDCFNRNNPLIHYLGRNYHENKVVRMDNEGSGFEVYFEGTSLKATMSGKSGSWYGYTMVSVLVDDEIDTTKRIITLNKGSKEFEYTLVENLTPGFHRVKMLKRTENLSTYLTLFKLETNGKFHPVNKENCLKMEVYGDSITAGYGNLRGELSDQTSAKLQSGLQTYASYTALALGAELNIQARSGIGMYTANNDIGEGNHVKDYYDKVNYDGEHHWNFDNYTPDIVLINLGTNDYWDPKFNSTTFLTSYINTVTSLANTYGEETSFILLSGLMEQEVNDYVVQLKTTLQHSLPNKFYSYQFSKCAGGHPLCSEHAKASDELIRLIKANHLDVIPQREEKVVIIPEATDQVVNSSTVVELLDEIKSDSEIYANLINNQKVKLEKIDNFHYQLNLESQAEGDLDVYFTIDDNPEYASEHYIVHVRKDFSDKVLLDTFPASPVEEDEGEFGWTVTAHLNEEVVNIVDESNLTVTSSNWLAGMVVRDSNERDNLKISATIKFGSAISDYTQAFAGLVPYYLDDSNFVVAYLQWDASGNIRGIGCTGIIEGQDIGWNDFFSMTGFDTDPQAGIEFALTRNGTLLTVECGGKSESQNIAGMSGDTEKVGVWNYCENNPVTYSGFTEIHQDRVIDETWKFTSHLFEGEMTVNAQDNVTLRNEGNWMAGFAVRETGLTDNYYISATLTCPKDSFENSEDVTLGLLPYYLNDNNFVVTYLQWNNGVIKSIGCTGRLNGADIGWNDCWTFANIESTLSTGQTFKVSREGATLTLEYGGKTGTITLSGLNGAENSCCGLYSNKTTTTFSNIVIASK